LAEFPSPLSDGSFEDLFMPLCKMPKNNKNNTFEYISSALFTFAARDI